MSTSVGVFFFAIGGLLLVVDAVVWLHVRRERRELQAWRQRQRRPLNGDRLDEATRRLRP